MILGRSEVGQDVVKIEDYFVDQRQAVEGSGLSRCAVKFSIPHLYLMPGSRFMNPSRFRALTWYPVLAVELSMVGFIMIKTGRDTVFFHRLYRRFGKSMKVHSLLIDNLEG